MYFCNFATLLTMKVLIISIKFEMLHNHLLSLQTLSHIFIFEGATIIKYKTMPFGKIMPFSS